MFYLINGDPQTEGLIRLVSDSLASLYGSLGAIAVKEENVLMEDIRWSVGILSAARLRESRDLVTGLIKSKVGLFPFYLHVNPQGACHAVTPPIVEPYRTDQGERRYLLLDGSHRCYVARSLGLNVSVLIVSFISNPPPLPCKPLLPSVIRIHESQPRVLKELFFEMSEQSFRPVRQLTHKTFRFASLRDALVAMHLKESSLSLLESR